MLALALMIFVDLGSYCSAEAWAQGSALEDVAELDSATVPSAVEAPDRHVFDYRGYVVSELGYLSPPRYSGMDRSNAIGEGNLVLTWSPALWFSAFGDGLIVAQIPASTAQGVVAQLGLRFKPADQWSITVGRERNFRAPGMLVNPSDFLHPAQTVPGQRMQRAGIWSVRGSYTLQTFNIDALFLPFRDLDAGGIPLSVATEDLGFALRSFGSIAGFDLGLSSGFSDRAWQIGTSVSRYVIKRVELHAEAGYRAASGGRALVGTRIDVGSTGALTAEGYFNGTGMGSDQWTLMSPLILAQARLAASTASSSALSGAATSQLNLFPRQWYAIASYTVSDILNIFNASFSTVLSLEDLSGLGIARWEWLVSGRSTLALLVLGLWGSDSGQYGARSVDGRAGLEWRTSF